MKLQIFATIFLQLSSFAWCICEDEPIKVFLLAGQSNMVGRASIKHFKQLLKDTETRDEYLPFWNENTNTFAERSDVFCLFEDGSTRLSAGQCAQQHLKMGPAFGPELGFGWEIGDAMGNKCGPIFLIKAAYGGRNIGIDFRPPSSGAGNYSAHKPYGWLYRQMLKDIRGQLSNMTRMEAYDPIRGHELSALVWYQGHADFERQDLLNEYAFNLDNLVQDIRIDLRKPNLPILIGGVGWKGYEFGKKYTAMKEAQKNVTERYDNMLYVPTDEFAVLDGARFEDWYHYYGRADTIMHVGRAFGKGMLNLLGWDQKSPIEVA